MNIKKNIKRFTAFFISFLLIISTVTPTVFATNDQEINVGDEFNYNAIYYRITSIDPPEVIVFDTDVWVFEDILEIPGSIDYKGVDYAVKEIAPYLNRGGNIYKK